MTLHGYEEVDHTADIALKVWAEDFYTLLRQAASGLYDLMGVESVPVSAVEKCLGISLGTSETILVDFLNELLYLAEEEGQLLKGFSFKENKNQLLAIASGYEILSQDRHIKAVTFHNLDVIKTESGLSATITFDV